MADTGRDIEEKNTERRAELLGFNYLDTRTLAERPLYKGLIADEFMQEYQVVPIASSESGLTVGITTMTPPEVLAELKRRHNKQRVSYVLISSVSLKEYFDLYNPPRQVVYQDIRLSTDFDSPQIAETAKTLKNVRADDLLAYLVDQAFRLQASDIHCENERNKAYVRMRVDGALYPIAELSKPQYRILISAIASAANLSTAAEDAQTGHISRRHHMEDGRSVVMNMRVETVPAVDGMDVVLRFFSFDEDRLRLSKLGMTEDQMAIIEEIIKSPQGLVLIVGPTGSGKTTTLYSLLAELRSPQVKIITLEDPVEFQMAGITQIPIDVHKGASFAQGLRAVLRLDTDVVMIGEIRDEDTAQTALQAALTGHLVLSTYHAASTALALVTLSKVAARNPLLLNAIRLIQGQRLVRRLDPETKQAYSPNRLEKRQIEEIMSTMPPGQKPDLPADFQLYKGQASPASPFGYKGRLAIREFLILDDELRNFLIDNGQNLSLAALEEYLSRHKKLMTMHHEGLLRVLEGQTTLSELYKAGI